MRYFLRLIKAFFWPTPTPIASPPPEMPAMIGLAAQIERDMFAQKSLSKTLDPSGGSTYGAYLYDAPTDEIIWVGFNYANIKPGTFLFGNECVFLGNVKDFNETN